MSVVLSVVYVAYALVQAILVARFLLRVAEDDGPVALVILMSIFAPGVSIIVVIFYLHSLIKFAVTGKW